MPEGDIPFLRETSTPGLYQNLALPDSAAAFMSGLGITIPGDLVDTLILSRTYATVAEMLASHDVEAVSSGTDRVALLGYYAPGDGGGGDFFFRDANFGEVADRGSTFLLEDGRIAQRIIYEEVNAAWFGAKFDMTHPSTGNGTDNSIPLDRPSDPDSFGPIQRAINYCLANRAKKLVLPAGGARITHPLTLGTDTAEDPSQSSFCIEGQGQMTNVGVPHAAGTGLFIDGVVDSQPCLLNPLRSVSRFFVLRDVMLASIVKNGATAGITFQISSFSGHRFENVTFFGFRIGFHIPVGSPGSNGEFSTFHNCSFSNLDIAFQNDANQAFQPRFIACGFGLPQGATFFKFAEMVGGQALACTATVDPFFGPEVPGSGGISHLILAGGVNADPFFIKGGRFEKVNSVVKVTNGGTENVSFKIAVEDCIFTSMNINVEAPLVYRNSAADDKLNLSVDFKDCLFTGTPGNSGKSLIDIESMRVARVVFRECDWGNLIPINKIATYTSPRWVGEVPRQIIVYENCNVGNNVTAGSPTASYPLNRVLSTNSLRFTDARDSMPYLPHGGTPDNLLLQSNFGPTNPATSWTHFGASATFNFIAPLNTNDRFEQYPAGAFLRINGISGVYQNIASIDLNAGTYQNVFYQGKWSFLNGTYRFSLRNSVTDFVYDQVEVSGQNVTAWLTPTFISLRAKIGPTASGSVQLRIEQLTAGINYQQVSWQFVTQRNEGVFAPTTTAAVQKTQLWESYCQTAKVLGRLQIPFKPDSFGSGLAQLLEAEAEIYLSSTTLRETLFTDRWETRPRQDVGSTAPTTGTWPQGFIRWNSSPTAGGKLGFVCVTAGTPGVWKEFGAIDA